MIKTQQEVSVCIVDDNRQLRIALKNILDLSEGVKCCGTMSNADEAIGMIPKLRPNVVLMDINLGAGENGIDCVRALKPLMPATHFMICTVYEETEKIFNALTAGATGYILKKSDPGKLIDAILELNEGGAPISSQVAKKLVTEFKNTHREPNKELNVLSAREKQILELLSQGLMYKEIAGQLFLSTETIRKHVYHVYEKLQVNNRVSAVNKFFQR